MSYIRRCLLFLLSLPASPVQRRAEPSATAHQAAPATTAAASVPTTSAVSRQSGIFAGDGGYRIDIGGHSELIGGLITSVAEAQGRNRFSTAACCPSGNHSRISSSIGLGAQGAMLMAAS